MNSLQWLPGAGRGKNEELLFNGHTVWIWDDENFLEMDGDDGYPTLFKYLIPLDCMLKNGSSDKFYVLWILPQ